MGTLVNTLGSVLHDLGDLIGAREARERALVIDEGAYGPDHPRVAAPANSPGLVLRGQGDLAGVRAARERALEIFEKHVPPDHPHTRIDKVSLL